MKRFLITGYKGFIGQNFVKKVEELGYYWEGYEWGDTFPSKSSFMNYDYCIHLGAITSTTERNVEKVMLQNYDSSVDLLDYCCDYNVKVQFASSASLYGLNTNFKEDAPVNPLTPYAWSKYFMERYIDRYYKDGVQIFRYFNVYGPHEEHKGTQASPYTQFRLQAENNKEITLFYNSEQYLRDFIHVDEIINYQLKFLDIDQGGIFNLGTGNPKSFKNVADEVNVKYNVPYNYVPMPDVLKTSYQPYTCADMTKVKNILGES